MKEIIGLRGNRKLWLEFSIHCKRKKKTIWQVLEPFIKKKLKK